MDSKDLFDFNSDDFANQLAQEMFDELFSSQNAGSPKAKAAPKASPRQSAPTPSGSGNRRRDGTSRSSGNASSDERSRRDASGDSRPRQPSSQPPRSTDRSAARREQRRQERLRRQRMQRMILLGGTLLVLILLIALIVRGCAKKGEDTPGESPSAEALATASPAPEVDRVATLAVVGDIMTHDSQIADAYDEATGSYDFTYCLSNVAELLQSADFTMGNFETAMNDGTPSGYPLFNSPDELATSLKTLGFDMVTTANNHCLDQTFEGLSRTLDVLDETGIDHVGTYRTQEEYDANKGVLLEEINGISVAFLDYTYAVNGMPVYNDYSVNIFNSDYKSSQNTLDKDKISSELTYAKSLNPDIIIVCLHWGIEYQIEESSYQNDVADYLIANGADLVLGGHPHVCQPLEQRTVTDENGQEHQGFVCYSLGNFISGQTLAICGPYTQDTAILNLELTKNGATGETTLTDVSYTPLYFLNRGSSADVQYRMYNILEAIDDFNTGNPDEFVDETVYATLTQARDDLAMIFGENWKATKGGF